MSRGLSNRKWKSGIEPETIMLLTGKDISKKQLPTPSQAIKLGLSEEVVESLSERHETALKLVRFDVNKEFNKLFNQGDLQ
jgi:hypothetical protein